MNKARIKRLEERTGVSCAFPFNKVRFFFKSAEGQITDAETKEPVTSEYLNEGDFYNFIITAVPGDAK